MTSAKKVAANRKNGQKSRGPKTIAGKLRSRQNALRHGLTLVAHRNPTFRKEVKKMAKAICCDRAGDSPLFEQAVSIAETQLLQRLVQAEKIKLIENYHKAVAESQAQSSRTRISTENGPDDSRERSRQRNEFEAVEKAMSDLQRLQRYERRALSRQRKAINLFMALLTIDRSNSTPAGTETY